MTRIVAGLARGRRLGVPAHGTRPTSDRAREGLFSTVESLRGGPGSLRGARVLDLYAGSGAVGLEALSRGAAHVLLVDDDRSAGDVLAANVRAVGLAGAEVRRSTVLALARAAPPEPYDLLFADPPYETPLADVHAVLHALHGRGWLATDCLLVVERPAREPWTWPTGVSALRERRYGEALLAYALW